MAGMNAGADFQINPGASVRLGCGRGIAHQQQHRYWGRKVQGHLSCKVVLPGLGLNKTNEKMLLMGRCLNRI